MKPVLSVLIAASILSLSVTALASSGTGADKKAFTCMDKKTFEINSECLSLNIENNLAFKKAEKAMLVNADNASDRALATMTFDSRAMTINIVAHKDATIANVDSSPKN